jgi:hypothetical protein
MSSCVALGLGAINTQNGGEVKGARLGPEMGWADRPRPAGLGPLRASSWPPSLVLLPEPSRVFSLLHVGP